MTSSLGDRGVIAMKNGRFTSSGLIVVALTAVVSLAAGHLVGLGVQILGSGPTSTFALVGNIAGLIACAASGWFGLRQLSRSRACRHPQGC
jgi:hypothetical protein